MFVRGLAPRRLKEGAMFTFRSSLIRECWQNMKIMKAEFEKSESGEGLPSSKAGEERIHDEQGSSRMDDEGCPNPGQHPDLRQRKQLIVFSKHNVEKAQSSFAI